MTLPRWVMPRYGWPMCNALKSEDLGRPLEVRRAVGVPDADETITRSARASEAP
jgi:cbb3-type cytochrome oxidase cytochrome c subunit